MATLLEFRRVLFRSIPEAVPAPSRVSSALLTLSGVRPGPATNRNIPATNMMTRLLMTGAHTAAPNLPRVWSMALSRPLRPMKKIWDNKNGRRAGRKRQEEEEREKNHQKKEE